MKEVDSYTIQSIGIPSLVLMEQAAAAVVRSAEKGREKRTVSGPSAGLGIMGRTGLRRQASPSKGVHRDRDPGRDEENGTDEIRSSWPLRSGCLKSD